MRHHFADFLDRDAGHWTVTPNRERHAYRIADVPEGSRDVTIVTIGKADENWKRVFTLPNLVELTLHEPTPEQLAACAKLSRIERLRITHARPESIGFIRTMVGIEELVLEYVSGYSDMSPLRDLPRLRSLHVENLRRVSDFGGLAGAASLKYLGIYGTLDWKQPILDFEFLRGLANLEVLSMWQIITKAAYPALLPALALKKLKTLRIHGSYLPVEEYALLEEGLNGVEGATWGPYRLWAQSQVELPPDDVRSRLPPDVIRANHPNVTLRYDGTRTIDDPASLWYEFTGKRAGRVKYDSATADVRCKQAAVQYAAMRERARTLISKGA
jgi:hypothetical protein